MIIIFRSTIRFVIVTSILLTFWSFATQVLKYVQHRHATVFKIQPPLPLPPTCFYDNHLPAIVILQIELMKILTFVRTATNHYVQRY